MTSYQKLYSFERRKLECDKIRSYWSDKIPIIAERQESSNLNDIPKSKILCPSHMTVIQFKGVIRNKLNAQPQESIFLFVKGKMPNNDEFIRDLYEKEKDRDGFLYIEYAEQETFGFMKL